MLGADDPGRVGLIRLRNVLGGIRDSPSEERHQLIIELVRTWHRQSDRFSKSHVPTSLAPSEPTTNATSPDGQRHFAPSLSARGTSSCRWRGHFGHGSVMSGSRSFWTRSATTAAI